MVVIQNLDTVSCVFILTNCSFRGQLHFHGSPMDIGHVPYMETDMYEGGSCKRFTDLPRIRYGSPTERYSQARTGLRMSF